MPRPFMKPQDVAPERKDLVDLLWRFYVAAGRPSMARISEAIDELDEEHRVGSANYETVRRTLRGTAVGARLTVEVIFLALCELADVDPDDLDDDGEYHDRWHSPGTHRQQLRRAWDRARDGESTPNLPRTRSERARHEAAQRVRMADDPWGSAPPVSGRSDDEPPF